MKILRWIVLITGIAISVFFAIGSYGEYIEWQTLKQSDPSGAELYEIGFWFSLTMSAVSLLVSMFVFWLLSKQIRMGGNIGTEPD